MKHRISKKKECYNDEAKLIQRVDNEYQLFRYKMLELNKTEIFESCNKIQFYCCLWEYFQWIDSLKSEVVKVLAEEESPLVVLWQYYLKHEYLSVINWSDIEDLLSSYVVDVQKYTKEDSVKNTSKSSCHEAFR